MNGNRSKYTYTPTYGIQKRGIIRKNASARTVPEAPDFTQIPDPAIGVPLQQTTSVQPIQNPGVFPDFSQMNPSSFSTPVQPAANQQSFPGVVSQASFMMPDFIQQQQVSQYPPVQTILQQQSAPLASNSNSHSAFSPRKQGFIPPVSTAAPQPQPIPNAPVQAGWIQQQPFQQSIPPFSGVQTNTRQEIPFQNTAAQQAPAFGQFQPIPQQNGFTIQQNTIPASPRSAAVDADKLLSILLFCFLPLMFIPCLFVPIPWNAIRYFFIAATVAGLGAMWYRQLYTPVARSITSVIYVALCITTIALLMQNGNVKQAATQLGVSDPSVVMPAETPLPETNNAGVYLPAESPEPTVSGPSEAERRLSLFMELWKVNNTTEMVNLVQPSWRSQQSNASTALFISLANRTPEDFVIEDISGTETDNSRTVTMRATINKNTGKAPVVYRFMVMMVKEGGEWYVNPNSLATNDAEETAKSDENVVKTQSSGVVTEPPRETVTPAPPASTMLYYNLGGNFYHMDPECPKVGSDYLPFDSSFPYGDLRSYNRDLLPCLHCNAPIDPLD